MPDQGWFIAIRVQHPILLLIAACWIVWIGYAIKTFILHLRFSKADAELKQAMKKRAQDARRRSRRGCRSW